MKQDEPISTRFVNVKIPEFLIEIIDRNLEHGKKLDLDGFAGRANFVQNSVIEKLNELNLLSPQDMKELKKRYRTYNRAPIKRSDAVLV